jgi:hypothetical protein
LDQLVQHNETALQPRLQNPKNLGTTVPNRLINPIRQTGRCLYRYETVTGIKRLLDADVLAALDGRGSSCEGVGVDWTLGDINLRVQVRSKIQADA